jgi:hypothetical protein
MIPMYRPVSGAVPHARSIAHEAQSVVVETPMRSAVLMRREWVITFVVMACSGCTGLVDTNDDGGNGDAGAPDAAVPDAGPRDAGTADSGAPDAGEPDGGQMDAGPVDSGVPDAGTDDAGVAHAAFANVTTAVSQPTTIAHPHLVTITFADDPNAAALQAFDDWIVTSSWLLTVGADYGVGLGTNVNVPLTDTAVYARNDGGIPSRYLKSKILDGTLPLPEIGADGGQYGPTIYVLYYPFGVPAVQMGAGGVHACDNPYAYDGGFNPNYQYAVIGNDNTLQTLEIAGSHEIIEAATNPCTTQGFESLSPRSTEPWGWLGGEVGDECLGFLQYTVDSATGYFLQRVWSTSAAAASGDPCIPAPAGAYFNVSPSPAGVLTVPAGQTATFTLTGWSSAAVAPWTLTAMWIGGTLNPSPQLSAGTVGVGQSVTVTLTVPAGASSSQYGIAAIFSGADQFFWPLVVVAQ